MEGVVSPATKPVQVRVPRCLAATTRAGESAALRDLTPDLLQF